MATETGSAGATITRPADVGLRREVGFIGAVWSSETSIIGSGWLFGALYAAQYAGPAAVIAWIIGGIAVIILALVHAELGGMYPVAGGTARFPHYAFGSVAGISFGFFSWLQAVCVAPIECYAVMQYASYADPSLFNASTGIVSGIGLVLCVVMMAIFTGLNFVGIKWLAHINSGIMWWKIAIPVLAIIVLASQWHSGNFSIAGGFAAGGAAGVGVGGVGGGVVFAYLGFEQADQLAGEVKDAQKNLPRAIITAVLIGTAIYILLQILFIAAMDPAALTHGWLNTACPPAPAKCSSMLTNINSGPFAAVAGLAALGWLAIILRIDAVASPFGTGLIYQTSTSRVGYGLGRNRYYPQIFTKTDSRGVPWFSLFFTFVAGLVFLLPFPSWHSLVSLVTGASVLMYAGAPLSLGAFRSQIPDASRPYRMGGAAVIAPIAFIIANFIIYWSGFMVVWKLGICIVIGYVAIGVYQLFNKQRPKLGVQQWKAASWLPVYLIGMGIISWLGQYSGQTSTTPLPPVNTNTIPLWWDLVIITVFSLIIYYWAQYTKLPREEVLETIGQQSGDDPAADAI
jgi:amino acid transporter